METLIPDHELTADEKKTIEEAKKVEFPIHATDPETGEVKGFRNEEEVRKWREETREAA